MKQWISTHAKQKWQRILFSLFSAIFIWWYVHENLVSIRTFTDVPIYVRNIPPGKTLVGLRKEGGRLIRHFTLTLKGRKSDLEKIKNDQIEVVIDASGKGEIWREQLTVDDLRCLNPDISLSKSVNEISHSHLQIHLTGKSSRDVPVRIIPPVGSLPKGYTYVDTWPKRLYQSIEGPEDAVSALASKQLYLSFDLNRVSKQQLDKLSEHSAPGSEIYFKVPETWKQIELPPPFDENRRLQDPDAESLVLIILKPGLLKLDLPIPIIVSPLPRTLPTTPMPSHQAKIAYDPTTMLLENQQLYWTSPIYIENVSREFLFTIRSHLQLVIYVGNKGNITAHVEIANPSRAERKYTERMINTYPDIFDEGNDILKTHLKEQFWNYMRSMALFNAQRRPLQFEFTVKDKDIYIHEMNLP